VAFQRQRARAIRSILTVSGLAIVAVGIVVAVAVRDRRPGPPVDPAEYAGDATCLSCHGDKKSFLTTAHHLSSQLPTTRSIHGSFEPGRNVLTTPNPYLHYRMEARPDGFYQTAVMGAGADTFSMSISRKFGMVIGSGRKGQTYLYWSGDRLFQLPISYWTGLDRWVTSPGYAEGVANFDRPVEPRCLECHSTSFRALPTPGAANRYDTEHRVLGIACEKCHGPGREHVEREGSPIARVLGSAIVNPVRLSREREVEVCASCHGGIGEEKAPAFSYRPGERLGNYLHLRTPPPDEPLDVHDNQVALLQRSACYRESGMSCATCHDVHRTQRDAAAFSSRCLTCHTVKSCGLFPTHGAALARDCVDCHMPLETSAVIVSALGGRAVQPRIRSHWIRVYPGTAGR
jgi:hypothetical protein